MPEDSLETLVRVYFDWLHQRRTSADLRDIVQADQEMDKYERQLKERTNWYVSRGKEKERG